MSDAGAVIGHHEDLLLNKLLEMRKWKRKGY